MAISAHQIAFKGFGILLFVRPCYAILTNGEGLGFGVTMIEVVYKGGCHQPTIQAFSTVGFDQTSLGSATPVGHSLFNAFLVTHNSPSVTWSPGLGFAGYVGFEPTSNGVTARRFTN